MRCYLDLNYDRVECMGVDLFAQIKELQKVISEQSRCLGGFPLLVGEFPTMKESGGRGVYLRMPLLGFTTWMSMEVILIVSWFVSWLSI